jgi:hypothetical protein
MMCLDIIANGGPADDYEREMLNLSRVVLLQAKICTTSATLELTPIYSGVMTTATIPTQQK